MNYRKRKQEADKIANQNALLAKRLENKSPIIHVKKFQKNFEQYLQLKKNISRVKIADNRKVSSVRKFVRNDNKNEKEAANKTVRVSGTPNKYISPCLRDKNANENSDVQDLASRL